MKVRCKDIGFGTYDCAYNIMVPWLCKLPSEPEEARKPKYIAVDKCMLPEILNLWEAGIKTTGCCCGHGREAPFISVAPEFVERLESAGYVHAVNMTNPDDNTCFFPMAIIAPGNANKGFNWWDFAAPHQPPEAAASPSGEA